MYAWSVPHRMEEEVTVLLPIPGAGSELGPCLREGVRLPVVHFLLVPTPWSPEPWGGRGPRPSRRSAKRGGVVVGVCDLRGFCPWWASRREQHLDKGKGCTCVCVCVHMFVVCVQVCVHVGIFACAHVLYRVCSTCVTYECCVCTQVPCHTHVYMRIA